VKTSHSKSDNTSFNTSYQSRFVLSRWFTSGNGSGNCMNVYPRYFTNAGNTDLQFVENLNQIPIFFK